MIYLGLPLISDYWKYLAIILLFGLKLLREKILLKTDKPLLLNIKLIPPIHRLLNHMLVSYKYLSEHLYYMSF